MRGQFYIRLNGDPQKATARWLRVEPGQATGHINMGTLEEAATQTTGCRVIALVPSTDVLISRVAVPTQNRQRMLKAIPFALEEQLAGDIEALHFAVGQRDAEGQVATAVVDRAHMDAWQERLRQAGMQADVMTPDVFALPNTSEQWHLLPDGDGVLVRTGNESGFAVDADNLQPILGLALNEAGERRPARLHAFDPGAGRLALGAPAANELEVDLDTEPCEDGLLGLLAKHGFDGQSAINLLQGDYSRREQLGKIWRPWRFAAALAGAWLVLQFAVTVYDNIQLENRNDSLKAQVMQIYKEAFPTEKNVPKPKLQMERHLSELRGGGAGGADLLAMLGEAGPALNETSGLVLRSVRFKSGVLDIELEVPSLQSLDQLKQRLTDKSGLSVEIQSAAARTDKVEGRIQIKSSAP